MQFADPKNDIALKESDEINALRTAEKKGLEKGMQKGLEEGMQKGLEEGERKKQIEIAKNLLDVLDVETISLKTGLDIEFINELK